MMGTISKDFSYREFEYSEIAKKHNILNIIDTVDKRDAVKALVEEVLQPLRNKCGAPLHINSGYRCETLNNLVGGQPTSQHLKGEACDVAAKEPLALAQKAYDLRLPYDQMIVYPTFVHFSHKLKGVQRKQILYNSSYKGAKIKL